MSVETYSVCYYYVTRNSFSSAIKTFKSLDEAIEYAKAQESTLTGEGMDTGIFDETHDSPRWTSF